MSQIKEIKVIGKRSKIIFALGILLLAIAGLTNESFAQRQPPQTRTPIGEINGKPIYADDVINGINNDSPFMPALEDDRIKIQPTSSPPPNATPVPTPVPRPAAPSFDKQIGNMMKNGEGLAFCFGFEYRRASDASLSDVFCVDYRQFRPYYLFFAKILR